MLTLWWSTERENSMKSLTCYLKFTLYLDTICTPLKRRNLDIWERQLKDPVITKLFQPLEEKYSSVKEQHEIVVDKVNN